MNLELIAVGIDGLLNNDGYVPTNDDRNVVDEIKAQGIKIVLCSQADNLNELRPIVEKLGLAGQDEHYLIFHDGALTYTMSGELIEERPIPILSDAGIATENKRGKTVPSRELEASATFNKGIALRNLIYKLRLTPQNVLVVGTAPSDRSMYKYADKVISTIPSFDGAHRLPNSHFRYLLNKIPGLLED